MSDKLHTAVFSPVGKCLTPEEMRAYDKGKLAGAEKHRVEKHLLDCELCSEAYDGIVGAASGAVFSADVAEINARARERAGVKTLTGQGSKTLAWASAAAVFLAVGITALFWFRGASEEKKLDQIFTQNFEHPKAEPLASAEEAGAYVDTMHISEPEGQLVDALARDKNLDKLEKDGPGKTQNMSGAGSDFYADQPAKKPAPEAVSTVAVTSPKDAENQNAATGSGVLSDFAVVEDIAAGENESVPDPNPLLDEGARGDDFETVTMEENNQLPANPMSQYLAADPNQRSVTTGTTSVPSSGIFQADSAAILLSSSRDDHKPGRKEKEGKASPAGEHKSIENAKQSVAPASAGYSVMGDGDYNSGIDAYNREDYLMAVNHFEKVLSRSPNHPEANFYAGISYLSLKQSSAAIGCLQRILNHTNGQLREDARWYLALAYIQKKDSENAEKHLQMLNRSGGKYQQRAQEALDDLDK